MNIQVKASSDLVRVVFSDHLDNECIAQVYESFTDKESKWLRIGTIHTFDNMESTPMCLTREDVILLIPILQHFAKHGTLPYEFMKEE